MTDFETISIDSSDASFREEFLRDDDTPIDCELEAQRPDKPFVMQLRDCTNRKSWDHLLDDTTDDFKDEAEPCDAEDALFDATPLDMLPEEQHKNPEDPSCVLDDKLAY